MKKKILVLFALLTVALLLFAACNAPSVDELQNINDLFKLDYSKITVLVNTKTSVAELNGTFTLTFSSDGTTVKYSYDKINTFDVDQAGNVATPDGGFIVHKEGEVLVRDGAIVEGEATEELDLAQLGIAGFSFKQAFFSNATLKNAKFEADVVSPQNFTGHAALNCSDMHVVLIRNTTANVLTSMELTYTSENGAAVKLSYVFTK